MKREDAMFLISVGMDMSERAMFQTWAMFWKQSFGKEDYQYNFKLTGF